MFYSPLKYSIYRIVWLATLFSNIGTWAHTVTASLLMTTLTSSAVIISLVQAAAMTPIFLFSVPGGIMADRYDRKSIIISAHVFMSFIAFAMAIITYTGYMTSWVLLISTFLLNIGLAFNQPAWQATSSLLIPKEEIKQAAVLNNLSFNISRCIGPALAGYFYSSLGPVYLFALNSLSFIGVILVFSMKVANLSDNNHPSDSSPAPLTVFQKTLFLYHEFPLFKYIAFKAFWYFLLGSCLWAILPYIIIIHNKMNSDDLGLLISSGGAGAILCALSIRHLRKLISDNQMTTFSLFLMSSVIFLIGNIHSHILFIFCMLLFGYSWSLSVSVFNGTLQAEFPQHTRSRIIGMYTVFFASAQALGGYLTGSLVQMFGLKNTLFMIASTTLLITLTYFMKPFILNDVRI